VSLDEILQELPKLTDYEREELLARLLEWNGISDIEERQNSWQPSTKALGPRRTNPRVHSKTSRSAWRKSGAGN